MYLTKFNIEINDTRAIKILTNVNEMHKLVMKGFPNVESADARKSLHVLYEVNMTKKNVSIIVQSDMLPDYTFDGAENLIKNVEQKDLSPVLNKIENEKVLRLEVISEPYKKVKNLNSKNSRRHVLTNFYEKMEWFKRKLEDKGCRIIKADVKDDQLLVSGNKNGHKISYHPSKYTCLVKVTDEDAFKEMLQNGIGSGKAYGMGMVKVIGIR